MGITNTIASIKEYFKRWHTEEYDSLHEQTKDDIDRINSELDRITSGNDGTTLSTLNGIINNINTKIDNNIDRTIAAHATQISDINSNSNYKKYTYTITNNGKDLTLRFYHIPQTKVCIMVVTGTITNNNDGKYHSLMTIPTALKPVDRFYGVTSAPWYTTIQVYNDGNNSYVGYASHYDKSKSGYNMNGTVVYITN